ncbi:MAG: serine/threonine protein kinase, partial [Deltaproteobacteria bacterium]|nr:serine/threonine protein kinase [Kofleriaceae bacterium]
MLLGATGRQCRRCRSRCSADVDRCPACGGSLGPVFSADATEIDPTLVPSEQEARVPRLAMELAPGTMVGDYRIEGKLGEGGMGTVYAATHPVIGKQAAVKVLKAALCSDADGVERFLREARAINQIRHPSIVDVFAFGVLDDGRTYLVMERLHGEGLDARLRRGQLSVREVADILRQVCRPLAAAHLEGIVHRDLKPENVFLVDVPGEEARQVKLLDFGLAKLTGRDNVRTTRSGQTLGTPVYMSPEQVNGQGIDPSSDVYSLGVMAFEMLAGEWPFLADSAFQLMLKHVQEEPPDLRARRADVPAPLADLVARMLSKHRAERPSLDEIRGVAAEVLDGPDLPAAVVDDAAPTRETPVPSVAIAAASGGRRFAIVLVAGVLVAGGVVLAVLSGARRHPSAISVAT